MATNPNTYWNHNGKHQGLSDVLSKQVPTQGPATEWSVLDLYRLAVNAYCDLYNNGFGNAEIRLPDLVRALEVIKFRGYVGVASEDVRSAIHELVNFNNEYAAVENGDWGDEGEEDGCDACYPAHGHMYAVMEILIDYVCELSTQVPDINASMPEYAEVA